MKTKLTIRIDSEILEQAKKYASDQKISLSKLIENYLDRLSNSKTVDSDDIQTSPLVKSLMGAAGSLPEDYNYRKEYRAYLGKKY
jgi:antitoxin component of RelBE/YafQ-DinJ toxin-antitoxin module